MKKQNKNVLPITLYNNHIAGNCLIACYLMVLNYFKDNINLKEKENTLYSKFGKSFNTLELIKLFHSDNFKVHIFSEHNYKTFSSNNKKLNALITKYINYIENENIENSYEITLNKDIIKDCIDKNEPIIMNCVKKQGPHSVVVFGYSKDSFYIADPSQKAPQEINFSDLMKIANPPTGFWMISISKQEQIKNL
jgi:hypothetical protein